MLSGNAAFATPPRRVISPFWSLSCPASLRAAASWASGSRGASAAKMRPAKASTARMRKSGVDFFMAGRSVIVAAGVEQGGGEAQDGRKECAEAARHNHETDQLQHGRAHGIEIGAGRAFGQREERQAAAVER